MYPLDPFAWVTMIVDGREQEVLGANAQFSGDLLRDFRPYRVGDKDQFPGHQRDLRRSVVQNDGARINMVVNLFESLGSASVTTHRKTGVRRWRKVDTGGAGSQRASFGPTDGQCSSQCKPTRNAQQDHVV
jgi:hypothetical protein